MIFKKMLIQQTRGVLPLELRTMLKLYLDVT